MIQVHAQSVSPGDHVVQFYERDAELAASVGAYLADALRSGAVAIVIADEAHRLTFDLQLRRAGLDVARALADGTLVPLDATATLTRLMRHGRVDRDAFRRVVGGEVAAALATGKPVRAYGEMVGLLWDDGNVPAAIELEALWGELQEELEFSLWCAYHSSSAMDSERTGALEEVRGLHSAVVSGRLSRDFPAEPDSARAARRFVADTLAGWGVADEVSYDAQLVLSELATNAIVHARCPFSVTVGSEDSRVRLEVRDDSRAQPTLRPRQLAAPSGRGLQVVAALAREWGVERAVAGKTVWAELSSNR
jgi:anti-sigma regulatory factor (Ser/Thr protein kinase)